MANEKPTDAELKILQLLWQQGPSTVRMVNEVLSKTNPVVYTTTLKIMQVMTEKGLLTRTTEQKSHVYHAAVSQSDTQQDLVDNFIDKVFKGSSTSLMMQVLGGKHPTKEELKKIKTLIEDLEKKTKGGVS